MQMLFQENQKKDEMKERLETKMGTEKWGQATL